MRIVSTSRDDARVVLIAGGITLLCACMFVFLYWSDQGVLLSYAYPAATLVIGGWLYISHSPVYIGFTWWIWFVTPFVRRVIDYHIGYYSSISLTMVAPLLVTGFACLTVFRFGRHLTKRMYIPFLLSLLGLIYGYLVGAAKVGVLSATYGLLEWLLPLLFGFHILLFWREYPSYRRVVQTTFTWGVLLMGLYGVLQYIYAPAWDMLWLQDSGMVSSMGKPFPFRFRVFSTLNSCGPFAMVMMAGLLLLFGDKGLTARIAAVPGYVSLLLSLVRGAWGGWLIAVLFLILRLKGRLRKRLIALLVVCTVLSVPLLLTYGPVKERVGERMETIGKLEEDGSMKARLHLYRTVSSNILTTPIGQGIGSLGKAAKLSTGAGVSFDSGVLEIPLTLGWLGTLMYLSGLFWMLKKALLTQGSETDLFAVIVTAVAASYIVLLLFSNQLIGLKGLIVWSFLGLALSAQAYYDEHRAA